VVAVVGWQEAKKAAWKQLGRRYWKVVIGVELARKYGPGVLAAVTVAALAGGAWWLIVHLPDVSAPRISADVPGRWWWWPLGLGLAGAAVALVVRRPDPLVVRSPAAVAARVVAVLAAAGAVLLLLATRDA
jgi:hypothetical protein